MAALRDEVGWAEQRPLFGYRVLLPFAGAEAAALADGIRDLGGEPWVFPRRTDGPDRHEIELLRRELASGAFHHVMVSAAAVVETLLAALARGGARSR